MGRGFFLVMVLGCSLCGVSATAATDFVVSEGGLEKILRLVEPDRVVEVDAIGGKIVSREHVILPEVLVASRKAQAARLAREWDALSWKPAGIGGHHLLVYAEAGEALRVAGELHAQGWDASPVLLRARSKRFSPADPYRRLQWHVSNRGGRGGLAGVDLRLPAAWRTATGRGVAVAIVDDGLQTRHPDLRDNCFRLWRNKARSLHFDFNSNDTNPNPTRFDMHGTAVAGLVGAVPNDLGGVGAAPHAKLAGLRLTGAYSGPKTEAAALAWKSNIIDVYNNSWGPDDDGSTVEGPPRLVRDALRRGVLFGRGGRGSVYVWAAGNGRSSGDDSNYDGYANSPYTIAVTALSDRGLRTTEGESGCNILVAAPSSSDDRQGLITTDLVGRLGYNANGRNDGFVIPRRNLSDLDFTNDFGMTSGSAPLVSGVVALMLEANPRIGWRDVQEILITTARRVPASARGWKRNNRGRGFFFHHHYGAGLVDAEAAVAAAQTWRNLPPATRRVRSSGRIDRVIPDGSSRGTTVFFDFRATSLRCEHVMFKVNVSHPWRGDLKFVLTSPSGTRSIVQPRRGDNRANLRNWTFTSVHHWGESSKGRWKLTVIDTSAGDEGRLVSASVIIAGSRQTATRRGSRR